MSRGNRVCNGKHETAVIDFCNSAADIRTAFAEYWNECVWGGGKAAAEARAAAQVDTCLERARTRPFFRPKSKPLNLNPKP